MAQAQAGLQMGDEYQYTVQGLTFATNCDAVLSGRKLCHYAVRRLCAELRHLLREWNTDSGRHLRLSPAPYVSALVSAQAVNSSISSGLTPGVTPRTNPRIYPRLWSHLRRFRQHPGRRPPRLLLPRRAALCNRFPPRVCRSPSSIRASTSPGIKKAQGYAFCGE